MALQKSNATQLAVKVESTFKEVLTFADANIIPFCEASFSPSTETLERCSVNSSSLLPYIALKGQQTTSGNITVETLQDDTDLKLIGHDLFLTALGGYDALGAVIDEVTEFDITQHTELSDGTDGLYYLGDASDGTPSLGIKYILGGVPANSVDIRGLVVESMSMSFPPQGIVKTTFNLQGSTGFIPVETAALTDFCTAIEPYIAKSCIVKVDGTDFVATDLEFTITNEIADFTSVNDDGVTEKTFTGRKVEGSCKLIFDDLSQINTFNSWADAELFMHVTQNDGLEMAIYIEKMKRTSYDLNPDDGGIITQSVTFSAFDSCSGTGDSAFRLAIK